MDYKQPLQNLNLWRDRRVNEIRGPLADLDQLGELLAQGAKDRELLKTFEGQKTDIQASIESGKQELRELTQALAEKKRQLSDATAELRALEESAKVAADNLAEIKAEHASLADHISAAGQRLKAAK